MAPLPRLSAAAMLGLALGGVAVGSLWVAAGLHRGAAALFALVVAATVIAGSLPRGAPVEGD